MKALGFRQANSWLHTWVGLLLAWLLYSIFLTGTLSFFQSEITLWMKPELHGSQPDANTPLRALQAMQRLAPNAEQWNIVLPGERDSVIEASWTEPGQKEGKSLTLDAATGEPLQARETRGGQFLYRFHFELFNIPYPFGRWIVCIATMFMFVAIVSGVIVHKKIFKEFFTFRPGKGQRSWLDAHNATSVLALPFHLMITYSGLLLFMYMLMPWGVESVYQGDVRQHIQELGLRSAPEAKPPVTATGVPLVDPAPLLQQAEQRWPRGIARITVSQPGTDKAWIEFHELGNAQLSESRHREPLRFDGVTGQPLPSPPRPDGGTSAAIYNLLTNLHLLRFASVELRWCFFLSGLLGAAMIATGLILWVSKRLPAQQGHTPFGSRLVQVLNVGAIAGLPIAIAAYFWANRLLPVAMAQRADWEIRSLFTAWALCLLHPLLRNHRRAWIEQLTLAALLYAGLPLFSFALPGSHLFATLAHGQWLVAGMDLTLWAFAALFGFTAWKLVKQPLATQTRPLRKVREAKEAPV
ncbi:PepSY-associated TM helix domain-containing protein [Azomonas macrocytogenes]|uniref:Putative iron-regulated membrane protein n=1 Tax=Azomonas macrocytogenes TaxID=69962 RepID=A0A839T504_AZOMA|nr:PepSY-associated TM helix domain-containing protein [Azomonas macrocytogenes]MBB3103850.1 putative iron-regulated membrane protein [Azomonas macrocytogenes]